MNNTYSQHEPNAKLNSSPALDSLVVRPILPGEQTAWNHLMSTHHYLGFQKLPGNSLKYVAILNGEWVALLGWGSAAFKCKPRDRWIGWSPEQQFSRLKYVANNIRFLILPGVRIKNLASKTLAMNVKRLSSDWQSVFGYPILLVETFVDHERFTGTCYRAAGWSLLGQTLGYGRNARRYYYHGAPKSILVYPLCRKAAHILSAPFLAPEIEGGDEPMLDLNNVDVEGENGLLKALAQITDPRKLRGIRHSQASILAIATCACLAGMRSYAAISQWAASLSQDLLRRFHCRRHPDTGRYIAPSEPTIRRKLQGIDPDEVDRALGQWLAKQSLSMQAVAVDGKTLKGARDSDGRQVHLLAALVHHEKVVIAQRQVDTKSNEITAFKPLLEPLDLKGKVVTADAMHTQIDHANFLVEEKKADYLFFVKENQETLLKDIKGLAEEDFPPQGN
ncbi:ISAs1 family transposase [Syntrophothermus sp.]|uniref:ISAs1 family transposase n=1 Tax=Syntrophothermus sp. TaxID=2736299 RepID=UPI00257F0BA7|nr:ISAs1 family transposase [Syntrophothermus sp.]